MGKHRVVLAGNNRAAVGVLRVLREHLSSDAIYVIAPATIALPDWQVSLSRAARENGVRAEEPPDVNGPEVVRAVSDWEPTLLLSVYYTQIFRSELLRCVKGPRLNFHPSLLPRHRGHAPVIWAIVEGDAVTGLTVHHIDEGIDTGPVLRRLPLPIHPDDTGYELHRKMDRLVTATAADLIRAWIAGALPDSPAEAQRGPASLHRRRDATLNRLDFHEPSARIRNIVRALAPPLPGAWVHVGEAEVLLTRVTPGVPTSVGPKPAGMLDLSEDGAWIWAADGALRIESFRLGGKDYDGSEFATVVRAPDGALLS